MKNGNPGGNQVGSVLALVRIEQRRSIERIEQPLPRRSKQPDWSFKTIGISGSRPLHMRVRPVQRIRVQERLGTSS